MRKSFCVVVCFLMFVLAGRDLHATGSGVFWMAEGPMAADFDGNGVVGFADFLIFLSSFNAREGDEAFDARVDLDGDGTVHFSDFLSFSSSYGQSQDPALPASDAGFVVYVADSDDSSVGVFDYDSHLVIDYLPFRGPGGVVVSRDQQWIYVSEVFGFFKLDLQHQVVFSVPTESRGKIVLNPDETLAYVTDEARDRVRIVDLVAGTTLDSIDVGDRPFDIKMTPDGKKLYTVNQTGRDVTVIDVAGKTVTGQIVIGSVPGEIEITSDGTRAYVTSLDRGVISVLDLQSDRVIGGIQLDQDSAFGAELSPDAETLYVAAEGTLLAINVSRNLISRTLRVSDNSSVLAISPDGTRAYVSTFGIQEGGPALTVVDLENWRVVGRMRGWAFPRQIAFRRVPSRQGSE